MTSSSRAVYVVNIDGEQYRRPAENPYVPMNKIKKDIKTYFELDYDFDLTYKGSKISETSALNENCLDDCTPLVVVRKDVKHGRNEHLGEERRILVRSSSVPRQISHATTIHKVLSLDHLFEENIDDETEVNSKCSNVSNEAFRWKPTTIIYISPARSIEDEVFNLSVQTSISNPSSSRSKLPSFTEPINQTTDDQTHALPSPFFSTKAEPVSPPGLSRSRQTIVKSTVQRNGLGSIENLSDTSKAKHPVSNESSNVTSGYSSSSSSRSSSPELSDFHLIVPSANRDFLKHKGKSAHITMHLQTLDHLYTLDLPTSATMKQLHHMVKQQLPHYNHTHTLLFFNSRMHIFKNIDIDNEQLNTFLALKTDHSIPDFFFYPLKRKLSEKMYTYEQDPTIIFDDSIWWQSHSQVEQTPLSHSTLLSTLYVLYQYFRRPPLNEKATRRAFERQFLLYLRKYLFPPAFQALKHFLIREIFAFEKTVLIDGLLNLLAQFCPSSIDRNLLGLYAPHLFCWLFERSRHEMETQDGFVMFRLMRYSSSSAPHYINDPVTIHDLNHDRDVLYEHHEAERYKNITRNVDLFSLIKHLEKEMVDIDSYTIDLCGSHQMESIDRLTEEQISDHEKIMSRVYRSFTLLIRNVLENSDVRDQLILVNNKQVGICFKRRQRMKVDGMLDQDLECFMPADPSHSGIVTLNSSDVFEVEHGRPDPRIPTPLRSNLPMKPNTTESLSPVQQITVVLLDISESMFMTRSDNNTISKRFIDISLSMLTTISQNLHRQSRTHAIGIILFGKYVVKHCPITTNADEFEKAIYTIPKYGQPWTSMYEAINIGFDSIYQYQSQHLTAPDCEKLIICITDGINNRGKVTIDHLRQRLRRQPVVIDLIFFLSNTMTSHTTQERNSINALRLLCERSGGIIYRNSSVEPIDLATTFEQEAVLWLKARKAPKSYGRGVALSVEWPLAKEPEKLYQSAVRARTIKEADDFHQRSDFIQQLHAEVNSIVRKQIENIQLYICRKADGHLDYTFWKVILQGPQDSLYANGRWLLYIIFPDDYPVLPPTVRFHTPIFHLNITADGHISHHLFDIGWSTVISMVEIFRTLNKLLIEPDVRSAASEEYVQLYGQNRSAYESRVMKHCEKHASKKSDELKRFYRLEDI